jgi:hypothetical protein
LKGIDLDAYSPTKDPLDRATDFFFLSVSLALLLLNIRKSRDEPMTTCEGLLRSRDRLLAALREHWPFGDAGQISNGRIGTDETVEFLAELIERGRNNSFAYNPDLFSNCIDRLAALKSSIFHTEIVLD